MVKIITKEPTRAGIRVDEPVLQPEGIFSGSQQRRLEAATAIQTFADQLEESRQNIEDQDFLNTNFVDFQSELATIQRDVTNETQDNPELAADIFIKRAEKAKQNRLKDARNNALSVQLDSQLSPSQATQSIRFTKESNNRRVEQVFSNFDTNIKKGEELAAKAETLADVQKLIDQQKEFILKAEDLPSKRRAILLDGIDNKFNAAFLNRQVLLNPSSLIQQLTDGSLIGLINPNQNNVLLSKARSGIKTQEVARTKKIVTELNQITAAIEITGSNEAFEAQAALLMKELSDDNAETALRKLNLAKMKGTNKRIFRKAKIESMQGTIIGLRNKLADAIKRKDAKDIIDKQSALDRAIQVRDEIVEERREDPVGFVLKTAALEGQEAPNNETLENLQIEIGISETDRGLLPAVIAKGIVSQVEAAPDAQTVTTIFDEIRDEAAQGSEKFFGYAINDLERAGMSPDYILLANLPATNQSLRTRGMRIANVKFSVLEDGLPAADVKEIRDDIIEAIKPLANTYNNDPNNKADGFIPITNFINKIALDLHRNHGQDKVDAQKLAMEVVTDLYDVVNLNKKDIRIKKKFKEGNETNTKAIIFSLERTKEAIVSKPNRLANTTPNATQDFFAKLVKNEGFWINDNDDETFRLMVNQGTGSPIAVQIISKDDNGNVILIPVKKDLKSLHEEGLERFPEDKSAMLEELFKRTEQTAKGTFVGGPVEAQTILRGAKGALIGDIQ